MTKFNTGLEQKDSKNPINVFYQNTFFTSYKKDEKVLRDIVLKNCKPRNQDDAVNLMIYYRNPEHHLWS